MVELDVSTILMVGNDNESTVRHLTLLVREVTDGVSDVIVGFHIGRKRYPCADVPLECD